MQVTTLDWIDILFPPIGAVVVFLLCWAAERSINGGRELSSTQRTMNLYGFLVLLGTGYSIMVVGAYHWSHWAWIPPSGVWALVLGLIGWRRHRRRSPLRDAEARD